MTLKDTLLGLEAKGWKTTQSFSNSPMEAGGVYVVMFGCRKAGIDGFTASRLGKEANVHVFFWSSDPKTPNLYKAVIVPVTLTTMGEVAAALDALFMIAYKEAIASVPNIYLSSWDAVESTLGATTEVMNTVANVMKTLDGVAAEAASVAGGAARIAKGLFWAALLGGATYLGYRYYKRSR